MDVLVNCQVAALGLLLVSVVSRESSVGRVDLVVRGDDVLGAMKARRYDLHLVCETSLSLCRDLDEKVATENLAIHVPVRRVLVGEAPTAWSVASAVWLGFEGVVDLETVTGAIGPALLTSSSTPVEFLRLSSTGSPIVGICHDKTDIDILTGIMEGLTDPEIADRLHYAVQSIRNRVSRILADSGARNRTHLAVLFLERGGVIGT